MYSDWVLSLRRPGCSRLLIDLRDVGSPSGELREAPWLSACRLMPCGSLTVSGITGLRRCNRCLREEPEEEEFSEALLEMEEVEVAGLRFGKETRPPGTLNRWARSAGLGGQTGLCLLSGVPHPPGGDREESMKKNHKATLCIVKGTRFSGVPLGGLGGSERSCNHVVYPQKISHFLIFSAVCKNFGVNFSYNAIGACFCDNTCTCMDKVRTNACLLTNKHKYKHTHKKKNTGCRSSNLLF